MLENFNVTQWTESFTPAEQSHATQSLEAGNILFFEQLPFLLHPEETIFLSPHYADPHAKNISYHIESHRLWGVRHVSDQDHLQLRGLLDRYAHYATSFIHRLLPSYTQHLIQGRTSFRPIEIKNRQTSFRKDDKRLHVDAFPSAPNQGKRILRVFTNVNPEHPRVWRIGEPFEQVAERFLPKIKAPFPGSARILRALKITKSYRTPYDHYMLHLHDNMKSDLQYQNTAQQETIQFPPGSTWVVQTDHVSHAAMAGQYIFEQTFYLPVHAMENEQLSPLRVLENFLQRRLI